MWPRVARPRAWRDPMRALLCLALASALLRRREDPECPPNCATCHKSMDQAYGETLTGVVKCDACESGYELTPGGDGCLAESAACPAGWTQDDAGECISPAAAKLEELKANATAEKQNFTMDDQADVCTELDQRQFDALACESYMCSSCCSNWCLKQCQAWATQYPSCSCTTAPTLDCSTYNETLADASEARMMGNLDAIRSNTTV